jgi:hypothetical protein
LLLQPAKVWSLLCFMPPACMHHLSPIIHTRHHPSHHISYHTIPSIQWLWTIPWYAWHLALHDPLSCPLTRALSKRHLLLHIRHHSCINTQASFPTLAHVAISHNTIPNAHTSLALENLRSTIASGLSHRSGILRHIQCYQAHAHIDPASPLRIRGGLLVVVALIVQPTQAYICQLHLHTRIVANHSETSGGEKASLHWPYLLFALHDEDIPCCHIPMYNPTKRGWLDRGKVCHSVHTLDW